jgi:hypothetical protein
MLRFQKIHFGENFTKKISTKNTVGLFKKMNQNIGFEEKRHFFEEIWRKIGIITLTPGVNLVNQFRL